MGAQVRLQCAGTGIGLAAQAAQIRFHVAGGTALAIAVAILDALLLIIECGQAKAQCCRLIAGTLVWRCKVLTRAGGGVIA